MIGIKQGVEWFLRGGPVMWPLLLCSMASLALILDRFAFFHRADTDRSFARTFCKALRRNDWQEADRVAQATKGGEAHLAVRLLDAPEEIRAQEAFIMSESKQVLDRYKEGLSYLSIIITLAPLLGLLGTITGMMASFGNLGSRWENPFAVTSGIGEALITTVFGLAIAIVTLCCHAYFEERVHRIALDMEMIASTFSEDSEKEPIIQLSPMIDLVFLLLVVFIVATMYLTQTHALPVNLPKGEAPLVEQKAVTVTIDKKGTLHLDGKALSPKELEEAAQQLPKATPVIVEADETVPYGRVMGTLEILRRARVTDGGKAS